MKNNLVISHNTEQISLSEAVITSELIAKGYTQSIEELSIKYKDFENFISKVSEKYNFELFDFSESNRSIFKQYISDDVILYCSGNSKQMWISSHSKTIQDSLAVYNMYKQFYTIETEVKIYMTTYYMNSGRLDSSSKNIDKTDIDKVKNEYYPYIDTDVMYNQFLTLDENILILAGAPGIGKTVMANSILKYCTENIHLIPYDKMGEESFNEQQFLTVCYVKNTEVLSNDTFWRELQKNEYDFVILDDLDYMLTSREAEVTSQEDVIKNKFINQFLSFTSGVESNNTKFIITTNQNVSDIDLALLRRGRLFDILQLRSLKKEEALIIWKLSDLDEDLFNTIFDNDHVLPADLGSEITKQLSDSTVATNSYLKESGISYLETLGNTNIGF